MKYYRVIENETQCGVEYQIQVKDGNSWFSVWIDKPVNPNWPSPTKSHDKEKMVSWCRALNEAEQFPNKSKVIYP
jgi:hypothetical protein